MLFCIAVSYCIDTCIGYHTYYKKIKKFENGHKTETSK